MNLSNLIASRQRLLEQTRLANTAYAYVTLKRLVRVVARAGLRGRVQLQQPDEKEERYWAALIAIDANQSVIDEHFSSEDVIEFADAVAFVAGSSALDLVFDLDEIEHDFIAPLATELERAGVSLEAVDASHSEPEDASRPSRD